MRDRSFVIRHREKNQKTLKSAENTKEEIKARLFDGIQKRYDRIMEEVKRLQDKKGEILTGPTTKDEILTEAKKRLRAQRELIIEHFLRPHLKNCKDANVMPFTGRTILPSHVEPSVVYLALSDQDIEDAVAMIEGGGISEKDRKVMVDKIDAEISILMKSLEDEREDAKRFQK